MNSMENYTFKAKPNSNDIRITSDGINEIAQLVRSEENPYGQEARLITDVLNAYPNNNDRLLVAMKVSLIDVTNSTNLSRYKRLISLNNVVDIILGIKDFDGRVKDGDCSLVYEIAKQSKDNYGINLFSFASKYCTYHNVEIYQRDDYSIFDGVLRNCLPLYIDGLTHSTIDRWKNNFDYQSYNYIIGELLDSLNIKNQHRRRELDYFLWNSYRRNENNPVDL